MPITLFMFVLRSQVDLEDLLPAASVMVVTVTATTTAGKALSDDLLLKVEAGCDMALQLDEDKQQVRTCELPVDCIGVVRGSWCEQGCCIKYCHHHSRQGTE
jgi:hypothetical protein